MKKILFFCLFVVFGLIRPVYSTTIDYVVSDLGGGKWEYSYTVLNNTLASIIEEFTIYFPFGLYDNLNVTTAVTDWDELTVNPQLILGSAQDGFYDALALVPGIIPGASQSGFSVSFDWLGSSMPGSQYFEIVDSLTFDVIDSGNTTEAACSVPEPGSLMLLGIGIIGLWSIRRKLMNK